MVEGIDEDYSFQLGPGAAEEGTSVPPCNVRPLADAASFGIRCVYQYYDSYDPDLIVTYFGGGTNASNEGNTTQTYSIHVRNQGTSAAPPFAARVTFVGAARPYPQGVCAFNSGIAVATTVICTTNPVTANFGGGSAVVTADYANQVIGEIYESNNTRGDVTFAVKPTSVTSAFVSLPYAAYGYTDNSAIETGFGVKLERKSGTCSGSSGWSVFSQPLNAPRSGTGQAVVMSPFTVTHGYCFRVKVTALGPYANSTEVTSTAVWYP